MRLAILRTALFLAAACGHETPSSLAAPDSRAGRLHVWTGTGSYDAAVFLPADYGVDSAKRYPLIMSFHGAGGSVLEADHGAVGGNGEGFIRQVWDGEALQATFPAIVVAPNALAAGQSGDSRWDDAGVRAITRQAIAAFAVDPRRVTATGLSGGGDAVLGLIASSKDIVAGFMPGAWRADRFAAAPCQLADTPVWVFGNSDDSRFRADEWAAVEAKIRACPGYAERFILTVYPAGCEHGCWDDHWARPEVQAWLYGQSKP